MADDRTHLGRSHRESDTSRYKPGKAKDMWISPSYLVFGFPVSVGPLHSRV